MIIWSEVPSSSGFSSDSTWRMVISGVPPLIFSVMTTVSPWLQSMY